MLVRKHVFPTLALVATALAVPMSAAAAPPGPPVKVVVSGLESPFGIDERPGKRSHQIGNRRHSHVRDTNAPPVVVQRQGDQTGEGA